MDINQIDGKGKTLREVFGQPYVLDYFQREYKWERRHIAQLIDDLEYCFMESYKPGHDENDVADYKPYFLGPYIIYKKKNLYSLIDGQQRLTSLMLLMIFIIRNYPDYRNELEKLIYYKVYKNEAYVIQEEERDKVIDYLFKDTDIDDEILTSNNLNLIERYNDIEDLFPENLRSKDVLPIFICWMKEKLMFVEILSYTDNNAYTIFETMNDRGFNLTPTEMLKSFLLARISNETLRIQCNATWKSNMSKLLQEDKESEAEFFRAWLRGKYLDNIKDGKEFEEIGTGFHRWVRKRVKLLNLNDDQSIVNLITTEMPFYIAVFNMIRRAERDFGPGLEIINYQSTYAIASSLVYPLYLSAINQSDTYEIIVEKISMISHCLDCFVVRRILNGQAIGQASIKTMLYPLISSVRGREKDDLQRSLNSVLNSYIKPSAYFPMISQMPYKFLRYFQYRVNLFLLQIDDFRRQFSYSDYKLHKLVYCDGGKNDGDIVKKENYREMNNVPIYAISYYDIETFSTPYYELVNNSYSVASFAPDSMKKMLAAFKEKDKRASVLCKFAIESIWNIDGNWK